MYSYPELSDEDRAWVFDQAAKLERETIDRRERLNAAWTKWKEAPHSLTDAECAVLDDQYTWKGDKHIPYREQRDTLRRAARTKLEQQLRPLNPRVWDPLLEELIDHAVTTCLKYGIKVHRMFRTQKTIVRDAYGQISAVRDEVVLVEGDAGGSAWTASNTISVGSVTDDESYCVLLHEIGHCVDPAADARRHRHATRTDLRGFSAACVAVHAEAAAWEFATRTACRWTRRMHDRLYGALCEHAPYASPDERDHLVTAVANSAFQISDRPWSMAEVATASAYVRRGGQDEPVAALPNETLTALETRMNHVEAETARAKELAEQVASRKSLKYCGTWVGSAAYQENNVVTHGGSMWVCLSSNQNVRPPAPQWQLAVKRGADAKDAR